MGNHRPRQSPRVVRRSRRRQRAVSWGMVALGSIFLIASTAMVVATGPVTTGSEWRSLLTGATPEGEAPAVLDSEPMEIPLLAGEQRAPEQAEQAETQVVATAAPEPTQRVSVPDQASGSYEVVPGGDEPPAGAGKVIRYMVEVERGLPFDPQEFAAEVHRILNHQNGWGRAGQNYRFERVASGKVKFRVLLASPALTDRVCHPLLTRRKVSCYNGYRSVVNARRWGQGSETYGDDLATYREYVVSHEVGHALGNKHVGCPANGASAPVMVQQTKSLEGCVANPWPYP